MTNTDPTRWEKSAARESARRAARAPLLAHAGLVPTISAEEQEARVSRAQADFERRFEDLRVMHLAMAAAARSLIAAVLTADDLARLDARRAACPDTAEYDADFWCGEARKRGLMEHPRAALLADVERRLLARAPAPVAEQLDLEQIGRRFAAGPPHARVDDADEEAEVEALAVAEAKRPQRSMLDLDTEGR